MMSVIQRPHINGGVTISQLDNVSVPAAGVTQLGEVLKRLSIQESYRPSCWLSTMQTSGDGIVVLGCVHELLLGKC